MRHIIVLAAAGLSLAGCSSFSLDSFQVGTAADAGAAGFCAAGCGCRDLDRTGLQDALLRDDPGAGDQLLGHLQPAEVPAGNCTGDGNPHRRATSPARPPPALDPSPVLRPAAARRPPPRAHKMRPKHRKPKPAAAAPRCRSAGRGVPATAPPPATRLPNRAESRRRTLARRRRAIVHCTRARPTAGFLVLDETHRRLRSRIARYASSLTSLCRLPDHPLERIARRRATACMDCVQRAGHGSPAGERIARPGTE